MNGNKEEKNVVYVAVPTDNENCPSGPAIFAPVAVSVAEAGGEGEGKAKERHGTTPRPRRLLRAALIFAFGFLVARMVFKHGCHHHGGRRYGHRGGHWGDHPGHRGGDWVHHGHGGGHGGDHWGRHGGHRHHWGDVAIDAQNYENEEADAGAYDMDGSYAGNESHDGWHAATSADADDDTDETDGVLGGLDDGEFVVERWAEEKEDGSIPGLP